jgi:hypothetical protein
MILLMNSQIIYSNQLNILSQHLVTMFNTTISSTYTYFYSSESYNHIGLLKVYKSNVDYHIYLLWLEMASSHVKHIVTFNETNRCRHTREFHNLIPIDKNDYNSDRNIIPVIKRYHQACHNSNILCFYDEQTYICFSI